MVNNVEREILRAEWENWLLDENTRCRQVQMMLLENETNVSTPRKLKGAGTQQVVKEKEKEKERKAKLDMLKTWQEEYCGSCKRDQDLLLEGRKHVSLG